MKQVSLSGTPRAYVGKKDAKKLRREGNVPCVMYGGKEQVHFSLDDKLFSKIIFTPEVFIINLDIDGTEHTTILQDVQFHPVTDRILHADFLEVSPDKPIMIAIPVKLTGTAVGVLEGGRLMTKLRKVLVKALVKDIPEFIEINIADMKIGDSIKIGDLSEDNIEFLDPDRNLIVGIRTARLIVEEVPEEEEGEEGEEGEEDEEGAEKGAEEGKKPEGESDKKPDKE
ncbi:MAG: 50S ribosomal protein L25/general stress protein Ctc [Bacteroidales bacterium]|nr:50S ribosomal protein L25/general stress protein Ctc [Bacteroidales bacterium]